MPDYSQVGSTAISPTTPLQQQRPSAQVGPTPADRAKVRSEALNTYAYVLDTKKEAQSRYDQAASNLKSYEEMGMTGKTPEGMRELSSMTDALKTVTEGEKKLRGSLSNMMDEIVNEEMSQNTERFITTTNEGLKTVNSYAVKKLVDEIAVKYGIAPKPTDIAGVSFRADEKGLTKIPASLSQSKEDIKSLLRNKITDAAQGYILKPEVDKIFNEKRKKVLGESDEAIWKNFTTDDIEAKNLERINGQLYNKYQALVDEESEAVNTAALERSKQIQSGWASYQQEVVNRANAINAQYQSGAISDQQFQQALDQLNQEQEQRLGQLNAQLANELAINTKAIASINAKYNSQLQSQQNQLAAEAERKIKSASEEYLKQFGSTPEGVKLAQDLKNAYTQSWNEAIAKDAKLRDAIARKDESLLFGESAYGAMAKRFWKSTTTALGGSVKGWASTLNSPDLYALGEYMERKYTLPAPPTEQELAKTTWTEKLKKSFQPMELAQNGGELLGGMAISMTAAAGASLATGGIGGAAIAASTGAAWTAETLDMSGRARDAMLRKTGDATLADNAFWDTFDTQVTLLPTYAFSSLPFVKGSLGFIRPKAGKVAVGALAEYAEETIQEIPQNIFERKIAEGEDPYEGFFDALEEQAKNGQLSNTLIKLLPVGGMGAAGQVMERTESRKQQAERLALSFGTKAQVSKILSDSPYQLASNLVEQTDLKTARAVVSLMYTSGTIDEQQMNKFMAAVNKYPVVKKEAAALGVPSIDRRAYSDLLMQHDDLMALAEAQTSEITRDIYKARAADAKKAAAAIAAGKADYVEITHPDGTKSTLTVGDAQRLFNDKQFIRATAIGGMGATGVQVSYRGEDGKSLNALTNFQRRTMAELDRIKQGARERTEALKGKTFGEPSEVSPVQAVTPKPTTDATQERIIAEDRQRQREGVDAVGAATEAGRGDRLAEGGQVTEEEVTRAPGPVRLEGTPEVPALTVEWTGRAVQPKTTTVEPVVSYGRGDLIQEVDEPTVGDVINMRGRYSVGGNVISGTISMHPDESQTVVLMEDNGNMRDIGSISDLRNQKIGDIGIEVDDTAGQFRMSERGVVNVRGVNYVAANGIGHIQRYPDGSVHTVTLPRATASGRPRKGAVTFFDEDAQRLAYEITLRHIRDNANDTELEAALAEARQAVKDEGVGRAAGPAPRAEAQPIAGEVRQEVTPTPVTAPTPVTPTATGPVRPGAEPAPAPTTAAPQPKTDVVAKFQKLDRMRDDVSTTRNERIKADRQGQLNQMLAQDTRLAEIDVNFVQRAAAELESQGKLKRRCP